MIPGDRLALIFDWPSRHVVHLALPVMLVVAFFAHVAGLAIFQLKPTEAKQLNRRAASVYVLPAWSDDTAKVAPMIAASDPALFSASASENRDIWLLPTSDYQPSFDALQPRFAAPPAAPEARNAVLSSREPISLGTGKRPTIPPAVGLPTLIKWTGELKGVSFRIAPDAKFFAPARQNLLPLEFLVAVSPEGRVLHAFPLGSSGNERIDRDALHSLLGGHFEFSGRAPAKDLWGTAAFLWGADIQRLPTQ